MSFCLEQAVGVESCENETRTANAALGRDGKHERMDVMPARKLFQVDGELMSVSDASQKYGIPISTLRHRMKSRSINLSDAISDVGNQCPQIKSGDRFGRLTATGRTKPYKGGNGGYEVRCDCGSVVWARGMELKKAKRYCSWECVVWKEDRPEATSNTPEYRSWTGMKQRCSNPNNPSYAYYGGRGIGFDETWVSFECFLKDMGNRPSASYSLDRIDPNKNYGPSNCRWATKSQQAKNVRTVNELSSRITYLESLLDAHGIKYDE